MSCCSGAEDTPLYVENLFRKVAFVAILNYFKRFITCTLHKKYTNNKGKVAEMGGASNTHGKMRNVTPEGKRQLG